MEDYEHDLTSMSLDLDFEDQHQLGVNGAMGKLGKHCGLGDVVGNLDDAMLIQQTQHHLQPQQNVGDVGGGQLDALNIIQESQFAHIISDHELQEKNIKDLNRLLKEKGLDKSTIEKLKQRRRTLKNRRYATDCREKKDKEVFSLENDQKDEELTLTQLEEHNNELRRKIEESKTRYNNFRKYAEEHKIQIIERKVPGFSRTGDVTSMNSG